MCFISFIAVLFLLRADITPDGRLKSVENNIVIHQKRQTPSDEQSF